MIFPPTCSVGDRRMARKHTVLAALIVAGLAATAFADSWTPYDFKGPAFYKYKITQHEDGAQEVTWSLDVKASAQEGKYDVTTTTTSVMDASDLEGGNFWSASPVLTVVPVLMVGNGMFAGLVPQMDLSVGAKKDLLGAGYVEVAGKETVAGVEGYRCEIHVKDDEKMVKQAEITIHPDLALPLRSRIYEDGKVTFEMELLEYRKH